MQVKSLMKQYIDDSINFFDENIIQNNISLYNRKPGIFGNAHSNSDVNTNLELINQCYD